MSACVPGHALPQESWELILHRLPQNARMEARQVCRAWNSSILQSTMQLSSVGSRFAKLLIRFSNAPTSQGPYQLNCASAFASWDRHISFLASMPQLQVLQLSAAPHHCLLDLRRLSSLTRLRLAFGDNELCSHMIDATPLSAMKLVHVSNSGCSLCGNFAMPQSTAL